MFQDFVELPLLASLLASLESLGFLESLDGVSLF